MSVQAQRSLVLVVCSGFVLAALALVANAHFAQVEGRRDTHRARKLETTPDETPPRGRRADLPVISLGDPDTTAPRILSLFPSPDSWIVDNIGLQEVQIGFDEAVTVPAGGVSVWTGAGGQITNFGESFDINTNTLTLGFTPNVRDVRLTIVINFTVVDAAGNELDGEILNPSDPVFPSGNGIRGGDAVFRFNILQGDADRNGIVDIDDASIVLASIGRCSGDTDFDPSADLNHDGCVNFLDVGIFTIAEGRSFPPSDGVAPAVAQIAPDPDDPDTVVVTFNEEINAARFDNQSCYLVDDAGGLLIPASASLAVDRLSADFHFSPALAPCVGYMVNVSNALANDSDTLLVPLAPPRRLASYRCHQASIRTSR